MMKLFCENAQRLLTVNHFAKSSILDVCQGPYYAFASGSLFLQLFVVLTYDFTLGDKKVASLKSSHIYYNDETRHSYPLRKEDGKNLQIT